MNLKTSEGQAYRYLTRLVVLFRGYFGVLGAENVFGRWKWTLVLCFLIFFSWTPFRTAFLDFWALFCWAFPPAPFDNLPDLPTSFVFTGFGTFPLPFGTSLPLAGLGLAAAGLAAGAAFPAAGLAAAGLAFGASLAAGSAMTKRTQYFLIACLKISQSELSDYGVWEQKMWNS